MIHSLERVSFHDDTLRYMIKLHMDRPFILIQVFIYNKVIIIFKLGIYSGCFIISNGTKKGR